MCTYISACRDERELQLQYVQGSLQQQTGTEITSTGKKKKGNRIGEEFLLENLNLSQLQLKKLGLLCNLFISPDRRK